MLRLAHQKLEFHRQRLTQEKQRVEQEKDRLRREEVLMLAELEEEKRRKLAEATLTETELTEDVLGASQSLVDSSSELSAHSQSVKAVIFTDWVINASIEVANRPQLQDFRVETELRPGSLTGVRSEIATENGRSNTLPHFVKVPNLTNSNEHLLNIAQYSVQPNATQPQPEPTNPDPVSLTAEQIATSKPNSSFTVPANHVLPNLGT